MKIEPKKIKEKMERWNITLPKELVEESRKTLGITGGKLSPVIANLLRLWIDDKNLIEKMIIKLNKKDDVGSLAKVKPNTSILNNETKSI